MCVEFLKCVCVVFLKCVCLVSSVTAHYFLLVRKLKEKYAFIESNFSVRWAVRPLLGLSLSSGSSSGELHEADEEADVFPRRWWRQKQSLKSLLA